MEYSVQGKGEKAFTQSGGKRQTGKRKRDDNDDDDDEDEDEDDEDEDDNDEAYKDCHDLTAQSLVQQVNRNTLT